MSGSQHLEEPNPIRGPQNTPGAAQHLFDTGSDIRLIPRCFQNFTLTSNEFIGVRDIQEPINETVEQPSQELLQISVGALFSSTRYNHSQATNTVQLGSGLTFTDATRSYVW